MVGGSAGQWMPAGVGAKLWAPWLQEGLPGQGEHLEGCLQDSWMGAAASLSGETDLWLLSSSKTKGLRNS